MSHVKGKTHGTGRGGPVCKSLQLKDGRAGVSYVYATQVGISTYILYIGIRDILENIPLTYNYHIQIRKAAERYATNIRKLPTCQTCQRNGAVVTVVPPACLPCPVRRT